MFLFFFLENRKVFSTEIYQSCASVRSSDAACETSPDVSGDNAARVRPEMVNREL